MSKKVSEQMRRNNPETKGLPLRWKQLVQEDKVEAIVVKMNDATNLLCAAILLIRSIIQWQQDGKDDDDNGN